MNKRFSFLIAALSLLLSIQVASFAQTTGSIAGTVSDQNGAVVPGANVAVKGEAGQQFSSTTNSNGVYNIPGVGSGLYVVTVTASNFKTSVIKNVKVDVGTPATVNASLSAGQIQETVVITSGAEVLQTETAAVGTTIRGRQITETPIQSRDALDLVTLLPGTSTLGVVRTSSVNGLPKSALAITIDGVDVNDNFLKSSDGFFTFVRPRIDAIEEVTVSTATPGAEASGDGAVAIKFVTRRGTNNYTGSAFWQHRDEGLNTNNWINNRDKVQKGKLRLNQFGARFGGPIPFLGFGEGVKRLDSGKDKRFFFVNYERFHLNEVSPPRTRGVATAEAQSGIFRYGANGASTVNLLNLAAASDCDPATAGLQPCPSTLDPTVNALLNTIRATTAGTGSFTPVSGISYRQNFNFVNSGESRRRFLAARVDFNITKNHSLENVFNSQPFRANADFLNNVDPAFPGLANAGTQNSDRYSNSIALRSSFGQNIVNEFRYAKLWGSSDFVLLGGTDFFNTTQGGYTFGLGGGLQNPTIRNAFSSRSSPTNDFTDTLTVVHGNHAFSFGGQYKRIETKSDSVARVVPTITFGIVTQDPLNNVFVPANFPGATTADIANAAGLYATLVGRVSAYANAAVLGGDGKYSAAPGSRYFVVRETTFGIFAQDSWRLRPNLTISLGLRWQPQTGAQTMTTNYARATSFNMLYDVSGVGNLFSPGTLNGTVPTVTGVTAGEKAFKDDFNNLAPSIGVVWSPEFNNRFFRNVFGKGGESVFRGGFSRSFIREGTLLIENSLGNNPGGGFALNRTPALGNLTIGTLFRTAGNPNLTPPAFSADPAYPRTLTTADALFAFDQNMHTGFVDSWSFGYQRQLGRDTVIEFRYVGNRGKDMASAYLTNETNAIENGFGAEFALAQQNLIANINAGRGANFRYFGAGTGTSPLPIMLSYFVGNSADPNVTGNYASTNFANATFLAQLSPANPLVQAMAGTIENNFRANGTTGGTFRAGRPVNFFNNCPTTLGGCYLLDNSEKSWFDSGTIELRRRLSGGLRFQASYTFGKSFTNAFAAASPGFTAGGGDQGNVRSVALRRTSLDKSYSQIDLRHALKFDATYDLPFGKGRSFLASENRFVNTLIGGWSLSPTFRWQSGSPNIIEGVQLIGMTAKELQKSIRVRKEADKVYFLPQDIIDNTIKAFNVVGTTATGYATGTAPTGRFIAPAGYNNCQSRSIGECGFRKFVLYGPSFFKIDASLVKQFAIGERRSVEFRVTAFDVLNRTNWRVNGWTANTSQITNAAFAATTFGQLGTGTAYQDPNGSNDPGGRILDVMLRINY